jgi:hypothetical protein
MDRPAPSIYSKVQLLADWVATLQALDIPYVLPGPRTFLEHNVALRFDVFLTRSRQRLAVLPVVDRIQEGIYKAATRFVPRREYTGFDKPDMPIIAATATGALIGFSREYHGHVVGKAVVADLVEPAATVLEVRLTRCRQCGGWYVAADHAGWGCQVRGCAYSDSDNADVEQLDNPIRPFPRRATMLEVG